MKLLLVVLLLSATLSRSPALRAKMRTRAAASVGAFPAVNRLLLLLAALLVASVR
jgi:hypothetical protein